MSKCFLLSMTTFFLLLASSALATPVQWDVNNHWYDVFTNHVGDWDDAIAKAASTNVNGAPGYLVSITSQAELEFLVSQYGSDTQYMIGLTDKDQEGIWTWQSGEAFSFSLWASDEPNNAGNEDFVCMNWQHEFQPQPQPPGAWNDLPGFWLDFIVEYDPIPEPTSLFLLGTGLGALGLVAYRHKRK